MFFRSKRVKMEDLVVSLVKDKTELLKQNYEKDKLISDLICKIKIYEEGFEYGRL